VSDDNSFVAHIPDPRLPQVQVCEALNPDAEVADAAYELSAK
jgi:hypothetical protein